MKKVLCLLVLSICLFSCGIHPKNFTYSYTGKNTGLDQLIDLNGYYVFQRECDTAFYSVCRFYLDGRLEIATTSKLVPELIACFQDNAGKSCEYILQGLYVLEDNRMKTQVVWRVGNGCTIFRDYEILPNKQIVQISEWVEASYSNLAYMRNYPSFYENPCAKPAQFYPFR